MKSLSGTGTASDFSVLQRGIHKF